VSLLSIKKSWLPREKGEDSPDLDELQATLARFEIVLGKQNVTEHKVQRAKRNALQIPLYYLAEWIAENWWVLLFEPQKDEAEDEEPDLGYIGRHSLLSAQHGFPLPALTVIPFGRSVRINCRPRRAAFAELLFTADAFGDAPSEQVQSTFLAFLRETDSRLKEFGIENTNFQSALNEITSLSREEQEFCELLGALGVYPSCASEQVSKAVEAVFEILGPRATRDYCLAAKPHQIVQAQAVAEQLRDRLAGLHDANLSKLLKADLPGENFQVPSWRRGIQAAKNLREKLKIDIKDEGGATKIFEELEIDLKRFDNNINDGSGLTSLGGAIDRDGEKAKIALFQDGVAHRRFAAGRAAYLCWVSESKSRRLMTNALTRDQQASRQFAAEILVPRDFLKKCAVSGTLSHDHVREIAMLRGAMPDVAFKQAYNANIHVPGI
jgi:hypothetical protein